MKNIFHYSYWWKTQRLPTVAAPIGTVDMSLFAILLFVGTMVLSLWATLRVRQVYGEFSQLPASSGLTGAETAATILRQEGIYEAEIVLPFATFTSNRRTQRVTNI